MTVRDERAAALIRRHRDLSDDFTRALPGLLDDLEAIDAAHAEPTGVLKVDGDLTEEQFAEFTEKWRAANPALGVRVKPETPAPFDTPVKPATRRRTTR